MKFKAINKRFTDTVSEYLMNGYTINSGTMSGTQGEIAHIDMMKGEELIRILIENRSEWDGDKNFDTTVIVVGRVTDKVKLNINDTWQTVWNQNLEVITKEVFYRIGERDSDWYGTKEEAEVAMKLNYDRYMVRGDRRQKQYMSAACRAAVLPFVKRQPRCKSMKLGDIENVIKTVETYRGKTTVRYTVVARGKEYRLH